MSDMNNRSSNDIAKALGAIAILLITIIGLLVTLIVVEADAATTQPKIGAHSGNLPGRNTVKADQTALDAGAVTADADIWPAADGKLIRTHDKTGIATGEPLTKMLSWAQQNPGVTLMIEWKQPTITTTQARNYATLLRSYGVSARTWSVSFHPAVLKAIRAQITEGRRGLIYSNNSPRTMTEIKASGSVALPNTALATNTHVAALHAAGIQIWTWTVNDTQTLTKVGNVDGVLTDNPKGIA